MEEPQSLHSGRLKKYPTYLKLKPGRIFSILGVTVLSLGLISSVVTFIKYYLQAESTTVHYLLRLFYMDKEKNVPTYISSLLLLAASLLLFYIFYGKYLQKDKYRFHWGLLGGIFILMSMDEFMELHESQIEPIREYFDPPDWFHFAWVIPAIVAVCIGGLFFLKFVLSLRPRIKMMFILSAILYVGGAIGLELISGYLINEHGSESFMFAMATNIEETLEMLGITYFIYALLLYIQIDMRQKLQIRILPPHPTLTVPEKSVKFNNREPVAHIYEQKKKKKTAP